MYLEAPSSFPSHGDAMLECNSFLKPTRENPFAESFPDPLCKLNLKETSAFVKSFPMATKNGNESRVLLDVSAQSKREGGSSVTKRNIVEAPSTPGRPIFSFSVGNPSKKNFPSKWDDAEKWLITGGSCQDSPAHQQLHQHHHGVIKSKQCNSNGFIKPSHQAEIFAEKSRVTDVKVSKAVSIFQRPFVPLEQHNSARASNGFSAPSDLPLKDKFANEVESNFPKFRYLEPMKEGFLFGNPLDKSMKDAVMQVVHEIKSRDIGTEMTPLGSSTTSRCPTPFKTLSPPRHNTPANRSGPLALVNSISTIDIVELQECHLAKLQLGSQFDSLTSNWSSREEEEEDISKSLRHFETSSECRRSVSESKACDWEEEEKIKCCLRYQREEAKIQAWVNLQNAKAEAQSKKLEVKIEKMRSDLEEKLMKRMGIVDRKAEELRAAAQQQHKEQMHKAREQAMKRHIQSSHFSTHGSSCGCFPCNNNNNHCH